MNDEGHARLLEDAWSRAAAWLADAFEVVTERGHDGLAPGWCVERGWEPFLRSLSDDATAAAERLGPSFVADLAGAPASLVAFVREASWLADVPHLPGGEAHGALVPRRGRREGERKAAQVAAFAAACAPLARGRGRVVDVGSGHGHLTRALARAFDLEAVGLERDARRTTVALSLEAEGEGGGRARFLTVDVLAEGLTLGVGDLGVGLHACGELGDALLDAAIAGGASAALVSCCLQKRRASFRAPYAAAPGVDPLRLTWPRGALGLSNLSFGEEGVEATREANLEARNKRRALAILLRGRGVEVPAGAELMGVNRRRAHGPLAELAALVCARQGLAAPSRADLEAAHEQATHASARDRRYALPRTAVARVVEAFVLYDRAHHLRSRGYAVRAGVLFSARVSPRNLALLASPDAGAFNVGL